MSIIKIYKITVDFSVCFERKYVTIWRCPIYLLHCVYTIYLLYVFFISVAEMNTFASNDNEKIDHFTIK